MGHKVDLNKPINSGNNQKKHNHAFYNSSIGKANNSNNVPNEDNKTGSPNASQKKAAEVALRAGGVPKGLAKDLAQNDKVYEYAKKYSGTGIIKIPLPAKAAIYASLVAIPLIALMIFVVVFSDEDATGGSSAGNFAYGQTCTTITVTDTGCNGDAQNCTNIYDGDVELEDYVAGVVAAEVGSANNLEYYKVAAIAARTFIQNNADSSCTVKGNATFQAYMDVEDSSNAALIKQAVEETANLVLVKNDELADTYYASACVVNADEDYYYVRYGTKTLGEANFQQIPKDWDQNESAFKGYLSSWYSMVDESNTDYENKPCPSNHDYGMSQIGALYLITGEDYDHEDVIEYYYGSDAEIMTNEMQHSGVEGYINPTRYINCSSAYGPRIHPVRGDQSFHSGLDIGISGGEPIYAAKDGVVTYARTDVNYINNCNYGYGNYLIIDHGNGESTLYAHIKYGTIPSSISVGTEVVQGEQIGQVGSTGCSTGNHLHYEVRKNNQTVDPADYLDLTGATGTCRR